MNVWAVSAKRCYVDPIPPKILRDCVSYPISWNSIFPEFRLPQPVYWNCALLGYYAVCCANFLPTFRGQPIGPVFSGQESKKAITKRVVVVTVVQKGAVLIRSPCLHTRGALSDETLEPGMLWIVWHMKFILIFTFKLKSSLPRWMGRCTVPLKPDICHPLQFHRQEYFAAYCASPRHPQ